MSLSSLFSLSDDGGREGGPEEEPPVPDVCENIQGYKEINELEALVESKIYREDELEQELERVTEKLARSEKKSKTNTEASDMRPPLSGALHDSPDADVCELCDKPGHDMFNCEALPPLQSNVTPPDDPSDLYCEDCDTHGHTTADCPHSMDVF